MIGVRVPFSAWQQAGVKLLLELEVPIAVSRKSALDAVETRIAISERTYELLAEGFRGRDFSVPCENGKTGRMLLDEAVEDIWRWQGAREFVLGLPWIDEEVRS